MTHQAANPSSRSQESRNHTSARPSASGDAAPSVPQSAPANGRAQAVAGNGSASGRTGRGLAGIRHFADVFDRLVGKQVIVADPESLEETLVGHQIVKSVYHAMVSYRAEDCLALARTFVHKRGTTASKETVEQLIPLSRIKRMTLMKGQVVLHL